MTIARPIRMDMPGAPCRTRDRRAALWTFRTRDGVGSGVRGSSGGRSKKTMRRGSNVQVRHCTRVTPVRQTTSSRNGLAQATDARTLAAWTHTASTAPSPRPPRSSPNGGRRSSCASSWRTVTTSTTCSVECRRSLARSWPSGCVGWKRLVWWTGAWQRRTSHVLPSHARWPRAPSRDRRTRPVGARWVLSDPEPRELDPGLLLWRMRRRINRDAVPDRRTVVQFDFRGARTGSYWLIIEPGEVSVCLHDLGFEVDVLVSADIAAFHRCGWVEGTSSTP